ncbi:hypothetical protein ACVWYG_002565 [Pedobacter sp. UYEF25]
MNANKQINEGFTKLFTEATEEVIKITAAIEMLKIDNGLEIVYIAGKVTGLDYEETKQKFSNRAELLTRRGYIVINPMDFIAPGTDWKLAMSICLLLLSVADNINLLPDWYLSKGAQMENDTADRYEIPTLLTSIADKTSL